MGRKSGVGGAGASKTRPYCARSFLFAASWKQHPHFAASTSSLSSHSPPRRPANSSPHFATHPTPRTPVPTPQNVIVVKKRSGGFALQNRAGMFIRSNLTKKILHLVQFLRGHNHVRNLIRALVVQHVAAYLHFALIRPVGALRLHRLGQLIHHIS